jgi:hypothetical protein
MYMLWDWPSPAPLCALAVVRRAAAGQDAVLIVVKGAAPDGQADALHADARAVLFRDRASRKLEILDRRVLPVDQEDPFPVRGGAAGLEVGALPDPPDGQLARPPDRHVPFVVAGVDFHQRAVDGHRGRLADPGQSSSLADAEHLRRGSLGERRGVKKGSEDERHPRRLQASRTVRTAT